MDNPTDELPSAGGAGVAGGGGLTFRDLGSAAGLRDAARLRGLEPGVTGGGSVLSVVLGSTGN